LQAQPEFAAAQANGWTYFAVLMLHPPLRKGMDPRGPLKKYFGFEEFRPLQCEIIQDALSGRDVFALLPTGGGKSLCFQLPALLRDGLTIVVSPLIALMKDQVDALRTSGIAATFLNSSLDRPEAAERFRGLNRGKYRLLYVAPERLMMDSFLEAALNWNIAQFAIDEAHCISEWGHDFRPEYRELKKLRTQFPDVPIMALTATATERVREDIVKQLKLREPRCYVASFNRPNLAYRVLPKTAPYAQTLEFLRARPNDSGIVYCASRKTAETVAAKLTRDGISAKPYHAGMESRDRTRHQEAFLRDDVRVVTATIAFGMGINKPNVRFVVHYDLPKNIEGYYQETGRAGRDGLPSECVLLFSAADVVKQKHFLEEKPEREAAIARAQLREMVGYAEGRECRRATLLRYFGEEFGNGSCDNCDNCLEPREIFDGTIAAQKFLSCVHRVQQKSGFAFGMNHIIEVLTGGDTEAIRLRGHKELSTYGIGRDIPRPAWQSIGRELTRLGFLAIAPGRFATIELTPAGHETLRKRATITLTKPAETPETQTRQRAGEIPCDEELFEALRQLRRRIADERDVPAYVIFSDVSLREMARVYPTRLGDFAKIPGVGQQKLQTFGDVFVAAVNDFLLSHPRREFGPRQPVVPPRPALNDSAAETLALFRDGSSLDDIARARGLVRSTICKHLLGAIETGQALPRHHFFTSEQENELEEAFRQTDAQALKPIYELLGRRYSYEELRLFRALRRPMLSTVATLDAERVQEKLA
jgi:ATP-dependent DNA helicase RecQ